MWETDGITAHFPCGRTSGERSVSSLSSSPPLTKRSRPPAQTAGRARLLVSLHCHCCRVCSRSHIPGVLENDLKSCSPDATLNEPLSTLKAQGLTAS